MTKITDHKWRDADIKSVQISDSGEHIFLTYGGLDEYLAFNESDAIAIAKHFGLIHPDHKTLTDAEALAISSTAARASLDRMNTKTVHAPFSQTTISECESNTTKTKTVYDFGHRIF